MNDTEQLKARSIELAERAYRLKNNAQDLRLKQELHEAANELILLENTQRFYHAQVRLEAVTLWTEDERALAHEVNMADKKMRNTEEMDSILALKILESWSEIYLKSSNPEICSIGQSINGTLDILTTNGSSSEHKNALNYILSIIETLLTHGHAVHLNDDIDNNVITLRNMRDSILSARELVYDEDELLQQYRQEGEKVDELKLARHSLDEIYKSIRPIVIS